MTIFLLPVKTMRVFFIFVEYRTVWGAPVTDYQCLEKRQSLCQTTRNLITACISKLQNCQLKYLSGIHYWRHQCCTRTGSLVRVKLFDTPKISGDPRIFNTKIWSFVSSRKHAYIILTPLNPYIVKLGFTGVYIIFLISAQNIDCGYSLEPPRRGGSNEYPQSTFWAEIWIISEFFIWKFSFFVVKFSIYLNRHVFVMCSVHKVIFLWNSDLICDIK